MAMRYWYCLVGPVEETAIPDGADGSMRMAVEEALISVTKTDPEHLFSGFVDEATKDRVLEAKAECRD